MALIVPRFEAHIDLTAANWQVKVDSGAFASLAQDHYFLASKFTGSSTASLLAELQTVLAAAVASTTVTQNNTTGIVTVTWGSSTHALHFATSAPATALGFDSLNYSAAATISSDRCPPCCWLPARAVTLTRGPVTSLGGRAESAIAQRAQSGMPYRTNYGFYTEQRFTFDFVLAAKTWKVSQGLATSWEQFVESFLNGSDGIFRYYSDSTDATSYTVSGTPRDYMFGGWEDPQRSVTKPARDTLWAFGFNAQFYSHP